MAMVDVIIGYAKGAKGDRGPEGPAGAQGPKGNTGSTGPQGSKGDIGPIGPQGIQGNRGQTGPQGPKGDAGAVGPVGPQGGKGDRGPQGPLPPLTNNYLTTQAGVSAADAAILKDIDERIKKQNSDLAVKYTSMPFLNGWSRPDRSAPYVARSGKVVTVRFPFCMGAANTVVCTVPDDFKINKASWIMFQYAGFYIKGMDIIANNDRIEEVNVTFIDF